MGDAAGYISFGYFSVALLVTAALALGAGMQFLVIGLRSRREATHLAFAVLCGCVGALAIGNALVNAATSLPRAIAALRVIGAAAALAMPTLLVFVGGYTGKAPNRYLFATVSLLSLWIFWDNLDAPYTAFDVTLREGVPITLPWGESLYTVDRHTSGLGWVFRVLSHGVFVWALYRAAWQFRRGERLRAALLGVCLLGQLLALTWGAVVVRMLGAPYPQIDAFAFLSFVLLMAVSFASRMHSHTLQLERTTDELLAEIKVRQEAELDLRHAAYHDALTGLPNRLRAMYTLADLIAEAAQSRQHGAVLMIDLDNFKTINDSLGHHVGDRVLETIADSLLAVAPSDSTVARLGGDEFVVLLGTLDADADATAAHALQVAELILKRLAAPLAIDTRALGVGASIGVALFPSHGDSAADVMRCADIALYRAKGSGRNASRLFLPYMQRDADARMDLERGLREALEHERFSLRFQPQVTMRGKLVGAEALLRWNHPQLGEVSPEIFIPVAEQTGLIGAVGSWVVASVCEHIREWHELGLNFGGRLSVNVSPWQIANPHFAETLHAQVTAAGVEPSMLTLELTESALLGDFDAALRTLHQLSAAGFRLALDDFGTGYSSLAYLQRLPLDELKIDRSFVNTLQPSETHPLAGFIIDVGRRLGMTTIAEGVETPQQKAMLEFLRCDLVQGYHICAPLNAADFQRWAQQHSEVAMQGDLDVAAANDP
ncbi:MAG TPA: EAL domain-containing protein [Rhodanobacter sp.]